MNRDDLQKLAKSRLVDARALLKAKRWSEAYYVAGSAVERGLKSCVPVRGLSCPKLFFEDRRFSEKCWTHNLEELLRLAGLKPDLDVAAAGDAELARNWGIVMDWRETSRDARETKARVVSTTNGFSQASSICSIKGINSRSDFAARSARACAGVRAK